MQLPEVHSTNTALARSLDHLGEQLYRWEQLQVRIECVDGRRIEGALLHVDGDELVVLDDASGVPAQLLPEQLRTVDINSPRRVREWLVVLCAIPIVTAILVAFSRIPGVNPKRGDIAIGFMLVLAAVWALARVPGLGKSFHGMMTRWDRVYPPQGA